MLRYVHWNRRIFGRVLLFTCLGSMGVLSPCRYLPPCGWLEGSLISSHADLVCSLFWKQTTYRVTSAPHVLLHSVVSFLSSLPFYVYCEAITNSAESYRGCCNDPYHPVFSVAQLTCSTRGLGGVILCHFDITNPWCFRFAWVDF